MAAVSLQCPECESVFKLAKRPAEGKKVKCPECDHAFVADENEATKGSTAVKASKRPDVAVTAKSRPTRTGDEDEDARPAKGKRRRDADDHDPKKSGSKVGLFIGLGVGAFVLLGTCVVGGGASFYFLARQPAQVAKVQAPPPIDDVAAVKPPVVPVVNQPPVNPKDNGKPKPPPVKPKPPVKPEPPPVAGPVDLDQELLARTKKATAFIRVDLGNQSATGSGFLVKTNGDTGYVITNFHVIAMEKEEPAPPNKGGKGGPSKGPKGGPPMFEKKGPKGGPFGGNPFGQPSPQPKARPKVTVVFQSGTPEEQSLPADVVAFDEEGDLAALRVTGARNLPPAIDVAQEAQVAETLPVYIFGFPGNKAVKGEPRVVTVGKGTISGLRRDVNNELTDVHINGEINPGNSGGPVIDAKGRLVGVAVATVPGKQIGFAVPAVELMQMFKGRVSNGVVFQLKQQGTRLDAKGEVWVHDRRSNVRERDAIDIRLGDVPAGGPQIPADEYKVLVRLSDPMLKINAVNAFVAKAENAPKIPGALGWDKLANSTTVSLKIQDQLAVGTFKLPAGAVADDTFAFQFSYINADGTTVFTQPHPVRLTFPKNPKSVTLNITAIPDQSTVRYIEDTAPNTLGAKVSVILKDRNSMVLEVDPVPDPKVLEPLIKFGDVTSVQGRTFAVKGKKLDLPPPNAADVAAALNDIKLPDRKSRIAAADQLAKAYVALPPQRAEVAKALETQALDKDIWVAKPAIRALQIWGSPDNIPTLATAAENNFCRPDALETLSQFKVAAAAEAVIKYLPPFGDRSRASAALKSIGPAAEKSVLPFVTNTDSFLANEACNILKEIGTAECIPVLTQVGNGTNNFVNGNARATLKAVEARVKGKT